ncbi:hypothetical protein ABZ070_36055 [Streptomyces sp. NPDC006283]|uniref:hypothetical protein n=1 Tax=Streptomyces sp. NPDC006283 TaxID=3156741 RepID=UPI0033B60C7A
MDAFAGGENLAGGETGNHGEGLAVEEDKEADDAVDSGDGVVVQEAADQAPAVGVVGQRPVRPTAWHRREGDRAADVVVAGGPPDQVAGLETHHGALCELGVDVVLAAGGMRGTVLAQPVEELGDWARQ